MANLFIYNPTCDMAVENGTNSFMPSKLLSKFENDISPLMAFLGGESDYLLHEKGIPDSFKAFWLKADLKLPSFITKDQIGKFSIKRIQPWGWSQIIKSRYSKYITTSNMPPLFMDNNDYQHFYSRQTSLKLCYELHKKSLHPFVSIPSLPVSITSFSDISPLLNKFTSGIVLKTLWSSSGRGLIFIRQKNHLQNATNWITAQLKKHGSLIAEPIYNKLQDASLQFSINSLGKYNFLGINYFDADKQGHFSREYFHTPDSVIERLPSDSTWIKQTADAIIESMKTLKIHEKYFGPIGIDTMFIRNELGDIKFYPLVEANLRCNMGLINLHIKKLIDQNISGTWQINQFKANEAPVFYEENINKHPLVIRNGRIVKGFFPLTPFESTTRFAAWGMAY